MEDKHYEKLIVRNFKFSIIKKESKKCIVSKVIFYLIGLFLLSSTMFFESNIKLDTLLLGSFFFYMFLSRVDKKDNRFFRMLNTVSLGIVFSSIYFLLGINNSYALFIYFIGVSILKFYNDRNILISYSLIIIIFNIIYAFMEPDIYLQNHSVSLWFYFSLFYFIHLIINLIYIYLNKDGGYKDEE
jgi:hypothetical protein